MYEGWVPLPRTFLDDPIFKKPDLLQVYLYCLLRGKHTPDEVIWDDDCVYLEEGSFITGSRSMAKNLGMSRATVHRKLQRLHRLKYISLKPRHRYSIVKVLKHSVSLNDDYKSETLLRQSRDNAETNLRTNNNDKNDNNEKEVFSFWNLKEITVHKVLTKRLLGVISDKLRNFSAAEIIETIDNYSQVVKGDNYYFSHRYTLGEFLAAEKFESFLSINKPFDNYKRKSEAPASSTGVVYAKYEPPKIKKGHYLDTKETALEFVKTNINNRYAEKQVQQAISLYDLTQQDLEG